MVSKTLSPPSSLPFAGPEVENLIRCNRKLKELGIEGTIKLPQICVIGDQSTGKSSLIEAISKIKVPRAAGCCTQCPIAINLSAGKSPDSPWQCVVTLEERYEYNKSAKTKEPTKLRPMGPWEPRDPVFTEFKTTSDKSDVANIIQQAQTKILKSGASRFSPNVVRLDISEGNWPNLSFLDLPGVITNTDDKKDDYLVKLVENLVTQYAKDENSINILTLPMTNDFANSKGRRIIQMIQAEPRTLAVLTKPDRVQDSESREQFLKKFTGKEEPDFKLGYRIVMMPPETSISHEKARGLESKFFDNEPWNSLDDIFKARLGVESLREYLRQILFTRTRETLPQNLSNVEVRLSQIGEELAGMPPPPEMIQLPLIVLRLTTEFGYSMQRLFSQHAQADGSILRSKWNEISKQFSTIMRNSRPEVILRSAEEQKRLKNAKTEISEIMAELKPRKPCQENDTSEVESSAEDDSSETKQEFQSRRNSFSQKFTNLGEKFTLDYVRSLNLKYYTSGIPRQSFPQATTELMRESVKHWEEPMNEFLTRTKKLLANHVSEITKKVFKEHKNVKIYIVALDFVKQSLDEIVHDEWSAAEVACAIEKLEPLTLDGDSMGMRAKAHQSQWKTKRQEYRLNLFHAEADVKSLKTIRKICKKQISKEELPPDEFKTELEMCAEVAGYYDVACRRFVDHICQNVVARLFAKCCQDLPAKLEEHLGPTKAEKYEQIAELMAENPEQERKRQDLLREQKKLVEGKKDIENALGSNFDSDADMGDGSNTPSSSLADAQIENSSFRRPDHATSKAEAKGKGNVLPNSPLLPATPTKRTSSKSQLDDESPTMKKTCGGINQMTVTSNQK